MSTTAVADKTSARRDGGNTSPPKNVLLINSYHSGYRWSDQVVKGIRQTITATAPQARIFLENMDSKRFFSQRIFDRVADLIREKYHHTPFDVVISIDDNALNFLRQHRHSLFAGIPVVFCGVNDLDPAGLDGLAPITGVNEAADVRETIDTMLDLLPDTRRIVVINDNTITGRNVHREVERVAPAFTDRMTFAYWNDLRREELLQRLAGLHEGDVVLFTFFFRDASGRFYEYDESAARICQASPVPVFGLWEFNLGLGIVGGKLVSGLEQGRAAGKMALQIINGQKTEAIPIQMQSPNRFVFDYRMLEKFDFDASRLPPDSLIINRPPSFYQAYKSMLWGGFAALLALMILIFFLLTNIEKRRSVEQELRRSEQKMSQIINFLPDPTFAIDRESRVIAWNHAMESLTGIKAEDMLGKGDHEYALPFYGERRPVMIDLVGKWNHETAKKYQDIMRDGDRLYSETSETHRPIGNRYYRNIAGPLYDRQGAVAGAIASIHDITDRRAAENALKESETLLSLFVEYTPAAVAMCDLAMRYLAYSRRWITDYHLPDEDLRGRCHYDVFQVIPDHWKREHQRCFQGEVIENEEEPFIRADGTQDWVRRSLHPWRDKSGEIGGLIIFTEVVTQKKQVENNLKLMEQVVQNSPAVLFRWRATKSRPVVYVSENVTRFGYSAAELISDKRPYADLVHPDDLTRVAAEAERSIEQGDTHFQLEYRIITKAGDMRWVDDRTVVERNAVGKITHCQGVVLDITDRKRIEKELRITQEIVDYSILPLLRYDKHARFRYVNHAACRSLGYSQEELLSMSVPDIDRRWRDEYQEKEGLLAMLPDGGIHFESLHRRKDGSEFPVEIHCYRIEFEGQDHFVATAMDISWRKQAENEIKRRERMLRRIMDIVPSMIFVKNREGRYLMANQAVAEMYDMSVEDLVGHLQSDIHPESFQVRRYLADDRKALQSGQPLFVAEEPFQDHTGATRWLEVTKVPCDVTEFGEPAVVGLARDITEKREAEEELKRLRNYLTNIIDSMPSVLVGVDAEGRVTQWNKQAERATGMTAGKAAAQPLAVVFPGLAEEMDRIHKAIREREIIHRPKMPRHGKGEIRFEDLTIYPLVANGVEGAVIRVDDVTERVRLEEMMIQSEKMLSVGGLAAGMAHEINNPLAGILQNAAVLESRLLEELPANVEAAEAAGVTMTALRRYLEARNLTGLLENIRISGSRAADIVKNMLSFARKSDRAVSSHDLGSLLDQTVELVQTDYDMKKHYDFKQIRIVREYDRSAPPVPCEASKLQQVFMNILKNGAEAMAERGDGRPQPSFILRVKEAGPWVRVEIEDNGPGMDETVRRRVFEPFFTTKPVGEGTGLGLSVSYFIVSENHGGEMRAHAINGGGTRFVIHLPKTGKP
jgi:PAS domain S-box-containing protein